jgi:hypothetical protein
MSEWKDVQDEASDHMADSGCDCREEEVELLLRRAMAHGVRLSANRLMPRDDDPNKLASLYHQCQRTADTERAGFGMGLLAEASEGLDDLADAIEKGEVDV